MSTLPPTTAPRLNLAGLLGLLLLLVLLAARPVWSQAPEQGEAWDDDPYGDRVVNGEFDRWHDGILQDWHFTTGQPATGIDGGSAVRLLPGRALAQRHQIGPDADYQLQLSYRGDGLLRVMWNSQLIGTLPASGAWRTYHYPLRSGAHTNGLVALELRNMGSEAVIVDRVRLLPVGGDGNQIVNGDFGDHPEWQGGDSRVYTALPGWLLEPSARLNRDAVEDINSVKAYNFLELDVTASSETRHFASQEVPVVSQRDYLLSLWYRGRRAAPSDTNDVFVFWENREIAHLRQSGEALHWQWHYWPVTATSSDGNSFLDLHASGTQDGYGGLLDDIRLYSLGPDLLDASRWPVLSLEHGEVWEQTIATTFGHSYLLQLPPGDEGDSGWFSLWWNGRRLVTRGVAADETWRHWVYGDGLNGRLELRAEDGSVLFSGVPRLRRVMDRPEVGQAPVINSTAVTTGWVGASYRYQLLADDPDGDVLRYSLMVAPEGMTIDAVSGLIQWVPTAAQQGVQLVVVSVRDPHGLQSTQRFEVAVTGATDDVAVRIIANPVEGTSPLTVRFSSAVENNNIVITEYAWDFDGDGTVDYTDGFGAPQSYTYRGEPGERFEASLAVTLASGEPLVSSQTITLSNQAPSVQVVTDSTNGHVPLSVIFTVTASDPQGIRAIDIDYEGDGHFDDTRVPTTDVSQFETVYQAEGDYAAVIRVTDSLGEETVFSSHAIAVDANHPLDPIVQFSVQPLLGNAPLMVTLSASAELFDGSAVEGWHWDLDGDGEFETLGGSGMTDEVSFTYSAVDNFYPVVEVRTSSGRTARASRSIQTRSATLPRLVIPDVSDTLDADTGGQSDFEVSLPFATELSVWLEDSFGSRVRTLQSAVWHVAGDYSLSWDALDDGGVLVSEGPYYVVLAYTTYGQRQELDLRTSTGGQLSYYSRTTPNPRQFDRLREPLRIDYAVDDPAEVSFFWQVSLGARLMTLLEHVPLGRGSYTLYWNGEYPNGLKIASDIQKLLPGVVRYALSDNVIFVKESPRIEDFSLRSTIIWDPRREPIGLNLRLSKPSTVEMIVADMDGGVDVASRVFNGLSAGVHALFWDGRNNAGQYLAPGDYRIGVRSVDSRGQRSLYWFRSQRIGY